MHRSIVLDYDIRIKPLDEEDKVFQGGSLGNFRYKHAYLSQGRIHGVGWGEAGWRTRCHYQHSRLLPTLSTFTYQFL